MLQEKSSGMIIFREQNNLREFLMLHYSSGHWDFPKGHIEEGENELQAAQRETQEETGITEIEVLPEFREQLNYKYVKKEGLIPKRTKKKIATEGELSEKEVTFFLAETKQEKIVLSKEHKGFKWLEFDKALKKITYKNAKEILKKANKFLEKSE